MLATCSKGAVELTEELKFNNWWKRISKTLMVKMNTDNSGNSLHFINSNYMKQNLQLLEFQELVQALEIQSLVIMLTRMPKVPKNRQRHIIHNKEVLNASLWFRSVGSWHDCVIEFTARLFKLIPPHRKSIKWGPCPCSTTSCKQAVKPAKSDKTTSFWKPVGKAQAWLHVRYVEIKISSPKAEQLASDKFKPYLQKWLTPVMPWRKMPQHQKLAKKTSMGCCFEPQRIWKPISGQVLFNVPDCAYLTSMMLDDSWPLTINQICFSKKNSHMPMFQYVQELLVN